MNLNGLIQMLLRRFLMRGIRTAIGRIAGPRTPRRAMTPAERAQADQAGRVGDAAKRVRDVQRITRRF